MKEPNYNEDEQVFEKTHSFRVDDCANIIPVVKDDAGEYVEQNPFFYQFNKGTFPAFRKLLMDYPLAGNVMLFLVEHMDNTNSLIVSYEALSEVFSKTRQSLSKAIKHLKEHKFIGVSKTGNMNVYSINANVIWHRSRKNIIYAKFRANVYMTFSEQEKKEKDLKYIMSKELKK